MPIGGPHFSSVKKARALLRERAEELLNSYINVLKRAADDKDYETAAKGYQHLLEHMPAEDGERLIDISIDKPKQIDARPQGPAIQIGIALGGVTKPKELMDTIIDVTPNRVDHE